MNAPRLYILMRTDMDSMNAGKGMAQAAHAANAFVADMEEASRKDVIEVSQHINAFRVWQKQTSQNFGTTLTLAVPSEEDLIFRVGIAKQLHHPANVIMDPTYPVCDGATMHLLPVNTCAYIFVPDKVPLYLAAMPLHP